MTVLQFSPAVQHGRANDEGTEPTPISALHHQVKSLDLPQRARERAEEHALNAVLTAGAVLTASFTDTLDTVVHPPSWTGNLPLPENQLMASAVTYLGSADGQRGWWLHYTRREEGCGEDGDLVHVLTLIAPCACGTYIAVELVDEDALIVMLEELDTPPGAPVDCDYRLQVRGASWADTRHDSTEPPF